MKATSEWFPAAERGLAGGFFNMGASLGSMLAAPLVAWAILTHSWQFAFVLTGVIGLVWAGLWLTFYNSPSKHRAAARERDYILSDRRRTGRDGQTVLPDGSSQRNFWGTPSPVPRRPDVGNTHLLAAAVSDDGARIRSEADRHVRLAAFPCGRLGCMFGGTISITLQYAHRPDQCAALGVYRRRAMMLGVAFVGLVDNPYVAVGLLSLAGFAHQTLSVTVITMASDLFKRNEVATVAGMAGTCGNAGVLIFSLAMGALVSRIGYTPFFVGLAALDVLGAVILWTVVREQQSRTGLRRRVRPPHVWTHEQPSSPIRFFGVQSRSVDRARRRRLLHCDIHVRMVPRRADSPLARPRPLAAGGTATQPCESARYAWRSRFVRRLGAVPHPCGRAVPSDLHRCEAVRPHHDCRCVGRIAARLPQLSRHQPARRWRVVRPGLPE